MRAGLRRKGREGEGAAGDERRAAGAQREVVQAWREDLQEVREDGRLFGACCAGCRGHSTQHGLGEVVWEELYDLHACAVGQASGPGVCDAVQCSRGRAMQAGRGVRRRRA